MSTKREPLLSEDEMERHGLRYAIGAYQAARAKDAELIQRLLDALEQSRRDGRGALSITMLDAIDAAAAAGFTPSQD